MFDLVRGEWPSSPQRTARILACSKARETKATTCAVTGGLGSCSISHELNIYGVSYLSYTKLLRKTTFSAEAAIVAVLLTESRGRE